MWLRGEGRGQARAGGQWGWEGLQEVRATGGQAWGTGQLVRELRVQPATSPARVLTCPDTWRPRVSWESTWGGGSFWGRRQADQGACNLAPTLLFFKGQLQ